VRMNGAYCQQKNSLPTPDLFVFTSLVILISYCITVCLVPWLSKSTKTTANFAVLKGWDHLGIIAVDFEFRVNHVVQ